MTVPREAVAWMSDQPLELITDWIVGAPILIRGILYGRLRFENSGRVEAFEPERVLQYSHWSSLSRRVLPDLAHNHVVIRLELQPSIAGTDLRLTLSNLASYAVYGHINYYWGIALAALKRHCESAPANQAATLTGARETRRRQAALRPLAPTPD
ncbi:SRPBCC domain-containing protein [Lysobacter sp. ISL-42]|nr:SRPBCC domain-containing protein [Lysobacter sp. ISL-42]